MKPTHQNENKVYYEVNDLILLHYKLTNEIILSDDGQEVLLRDLEEAEKVAKLILEIVRKANV